MRSHKLGIVFRIILTLTLTLGALLAITVPALAATPVANFSGAGVLTGTTTIGAGETVQFTDKSSYVPTSWSWNFGDGGTSTSQHPTHVYASAGTYTVALTATNGTGTNTKTVSNYITVLASMTHTATLTMVPSTQTVVAGNTFSITVAVAMATGQGTTSIDAFMNFDPAVLQVDSIASATGNKLTNILTNQWDNSIGTADFNGSNLTAQTGSFNLLTITFLTADGATDSPIVFSTAEIDPLRTTSVAFGGTNLLLNTGSTITNATVTILVPPTANFTAAGASSGTTTVAAGEVVNFTDTTTGVPSSWDWDFDTSTPSTDSTSQNPSHTYTTAGTYSVRLTATNDAGTDTITRTSYVTVTAGALDHITVSPSNPSVVAGGSQTYTAASYDSYGNARSGDVFTWSAGATAGTIDATTGVLTASTTAGALTNVIHATSGAVTGDASVTITAGALDHITVSPSNPSVTVGGSQTFTAVSYDAYGNARTGDPIAWSVTNGDAGGINASTGAFTAGTVADTYSDVVVATSGAITGEASVTLIAGPLHHITVSPSNPSVAVDGSQTFTATTYDQYDNARTGDTIAWSVPNPTAGSINASTGVFTAGTVAGSYTNAIVATSGAVTGNASVTVTPGALDHITVSPSNPSVTVGGSQTYTAVSYDVYNNARTGDTITWSLAIAEAGSINATTGVLTAGTTAGIYVDAIVATSGAITGEASVTLVAGALHHITVSPSNPSVTVGGSQAFTAATYDQYDNERTGDLIAWSVTANGSINASTGAFTAGTVAGVYSNGIVATAGGISGNTSVTVTPGALNYITVSPSNPSVVVAAGQTFTAVSYDAYGNARTGDPIAWSVTNATAGGINASTGAFTAGTVSGSYSSVVVATSGAVTGVASVTVTPGALHHVTVSPDSASVVAGGTQTFTATAYDEYDNVRSDTITWSTNNPTGGSINASSGGFTAGTVAATYTNLVQAASGAYADHATVIVVPAPLHRIQVEPIYPAVVVAETQTYTATAYDQYDNIRADAITWSVTDPTAGSINATSGEFTAGTVADNYPTTIVATSGAITGYAGVVVNPGPVHHITVTPSSASLQVDDMQTFTATLYDEYDNLRPDSADELNWNVADSAAGLIHPVDGQFTAGTVAGTYTNTIQAISGAIVGTASVTVTAGPLDHITVSPSNPSVVAAGSQTYTAAAYDAYENIRTGDTVAWSVTDATAGSINASTGVLTAGTVAGAYTNVIHATSGGITGDGSVTIIPAALNHIAVTPSNPSVVVGGSQPYAAATFDVYNNARVGDIVSWSVSNATAGTINASTGVLTAGTVTGSYPDVIVATSGAITGSGSVTLTVGALHHITITPASPSVGRNHNKTFSAAGYDQYNNLRSGDVFTWGVTDATAGAINPGTGVFTAGSTNGTYTDVIEASTGAVTGTQTVIVRDPVIATLDAGGTPVSVLVGQEFPVNIKLSTGSQQISAMDAFGDFDTTYLEVMSITQNATSLPIELTNTYDNTDGTFQYSGSRLTGTMPSGIFTVATITFRAKAVTSLTTMTLSTSGMRTTTAAYTGSNYLDEVVSGTAIITYDVPVVISGMPASADMLTEFTANIVVNAGTAQADGASVYLDYDPDYLQVNSIDNGAFATVFESTYDNALGRLTFSSTDATGATGSFTLATVHFEGKAVIASTSVSISMTDPRQTTVTYQGVVVPGLHGAPAEVEITPGGIINGTVNLQGSTRPASGRTIPITVKLFSVDAARTNATYFAGTGAVATYSLTTTNTGTNAVTFQISGVTPGSYDITIMSDHALMNVKKNVSVSGPTSIDFGTLLEGNANADIQITALDFSILAATYLKATGQTGFDSRADFDATGQVNSLDFSLLAANYLKTVQTV